MITRLCLYFIFVLFGFELTYGQITNSSSGRVKEIKTDFTWKIIDGQYNRTLWQSGWKSGVGDFVSIKHGGNNTEANTYGIRMSDSKGFEFGKNDFTSTLLNIKTNGNVGIGTIPPNDTRLYVKSNLKVGFLTEVNHSLDHQFGIVSAVNRSGTRAFSILLKGSSGYTDTFAVMGNGEVRATEINVKVPIFPDFVFEKDYDLPTIKEVEEYIKENGHLKDIPSAKEVEQNGVNLGDLNTKLLQKIEELMLYTIQQQKEIESLKEQVKGLKK